MVATYFEVELRTIERYVSDNQAEISSNGYEILKSNRLKTFLSCVSEQDVPDINVGNISGTKVPGETVPLFKFQRYIMRL